MAQGFQRIFSQGQPGQLSADDLITALQGPDGWVEVRFATVTGAVALNSAQVASRIILRDCAFTDPVQFEGTVFHKTVDLSGSTFQRGLTLSGARIEGTLRLDGAVLHADSESPASFAFDLLQVTGNFLAQGIWVGAGLDLGQAQINGRLDLSSTSERCTVCKGDLALSGARVQGNLWCRGARIEGKLILEGAVIEGSISCGPLRESDQIEDSRVLATTWIGGSALLEGCQVAIEVDFCCAEIGKDFILQAAQIKGGLFCRTVQGRPTVVLGDLRAPEAQVMGTADFGGIDIRGDLMLEGFHVQGTLFLTNGLFVFDGKPRVDRPPMEPEAAPLDPGAIGSRPIVSPTRENLRSRIGKGLSLSHAEIKGRLNATELCAGFINLEAVEVAGAVDLGGAQIGYGPDAPSGGEPDLASGEEYSLMGIGARIAGSLNLGGAKLEKGLFLQSSEVEGGLFCPLWTSPDQEARRTTIGGDLFLAGATISGELSLVDASISGDLSLDRATVNGTLRCRIFNPPSAPAASEPHRAGVAGIIELSNATLRHLELSGADLPGGTASGKITPVPIRLDGCEFQDLTVPDNDYLVLFRSRRVGFRRSNYVMVEKWLRNRGDDDSAQKIFWTMRRHQSQWMPLSRWQRSWDQALGVVIYLAMHFQWLLVGSVLAMMLTIALFLPPMAAVPAAPEKSQVSAIKWSPGEAAWLALRVHLPIVTLPFNDHWRPSDQPIIVRGRKLPLSYRYYASLISLLSYITIPMILGGIANRWLRQKGTSD